MMANSRPAVALGGWVRAGESRCIRHAAGENFPPIRIRRLALAAKCSRSDSSRPADLEIPASLRGLLILTSEVRAASVQAVQSTGNKSLIPLLLPMLAYEIAHIPDPTDKTDKPKLIDRVDWTEPSPAVRLAVIQAAPAEIKSVDALPALIDAMERAESFHRLAIIGAIKDVGPTAAPVCLGRIVPLPYDKEAITTQMPVLINNGAQLAVIALGTTWAMPAASPICSTRSSCHGKDLASTRM